MRKIFGAVTVAFALLVMGTVPAQAEAPSPSVASNVTDKADKIDDARMEMLIKQVQDETDYELYVYVTDSLSGMSGAQWAVETAKKSGLDATNAVLFVIATQDRKYGSAYPTGSSISSQISTVEASAIPLMKAGDWNGAVEAYGNKLISASHAGVVTKQETGVNTDKAVAGFFGVVTFIVSGLAGLAVLGLVIFFLRRFAINFGKYRKDVKDTVAQIAKFNATLPSMVTKIDSELNDVNERISFASAMHGEDVMEFALRSAKSASTSLQTAITYMGEASATKDRDVIRKSLKDASNSLHTAKSEVASAQKVLNDLKVQQESIASKTADLKEISKTLNASVKSYESKVEKLSASFDADYVANLKGIFNNLKERAVDLDSKVATISPDIDFPKARNDVSEATLMAERASRLEVAFAKDLIAINEFDKNRNALINRNLKAMSANEGINGHESIVKSYTKAMEGLSAAKLIADGTGNPAKELSAALRPMEAYLSDVRILKNHAESVSGLKKIIASILSQKWGEVDTLVKNVKAYQIHTAPSEKEALDQAVAMTGAAFKALRAKSDASPAYDREAIALIGEEVNDIIADVNAKVASVSVKVAHIQAQREEARKQEQERQRKAKAEEEARRKKKRREEEEEEARRRRNRSSSSSSSSYSGYSSSYSSSSSPSSFSGSGGSFGGDSGSGGSF